MELIDGLEIYKTTTFFERANQLEKDAVEVLSLINKYGNNPTKEAMEKARMFLIEVEKWKADCLEERTGNAQQNEDSLIWRAIQDATQAENCLGKIKSIMQLKGFGMSEDRETGQRRAKLATTVLRFLWPNDWGVVDWRVATMVGLLTKNNLNVDKTMEETKSHKSHDCKNAYDIIDENAACKFIQIYKEILCDQEQLKQAADVDMAIFGLSLKAWPMY